MRYGQNLLDEILRRTDIVQLVGRRVKLTRRGNAFWGCCPFHKEKSASFKVENARRTYKCFGCGAGGDAFKWLMETEGLTFPESVERLAGEAGVELPKWSSADEAQAEKRKTLYEVIEAAAGFFESALRGAAGAEARAYLKSRGIDGAVARRFRLGFAPSGNPLLTYLAAKNIPQADIIAAGLARPADERRGVRDFFYDRVMFPIPDGRGRIVAFGGRGMAADAKPKYINTGDTPLFSKGHLLYNLAAARPAAIRAQSIILCEGYMDVIALVSAGFEAAVAPLGTALTEDQLQLLWRLAPEPTVTFDGDEAGLKAAARAAHLALPALKPGYSLRFAFLPPGEDPDSLIRGSGAAAMSAVLEKAESLAEVLWRVETAERDFSTPERRAGLEQRLSEVVGAITDAKIADYYRRDFADRVFQAFKARRSAPQPERGGWGKREGRREGFRRDPYAVPVSEAVKSSALARGGAVASLRTREWELAGLLFASPWLALDQSEKLARLPFSDPLLDRFRRELLNLAASGRALESGTLNDHLIKLGLSELGSRLQSDVRKSGDQPGVESGTVDKKAVETDFLRASAQLLSLGSSHADPAPTSGQDALKSKLKLADARWRKEHEL